MKLAEHLRGSVTKLFPNAYKQSVRGLLLYTANDQTTHDYLGNITFYAFILSLLTYFVSTIMDIIQPLAVLYMIIAFVSVEGLFYVLLYIKAERIRDEIENQLPDALQVIAANLDAGTTPYQALKSAVKKEFGVLGRLFDKATKKALASENFSEALADVARNTNSSIFKRTVKLIGSAMRSGGNLAPILRELAADISERKMLKQEMITNTKTYTMFIMFTIIVGAPLLFAISIHFVTIVNDLQSTAQLTSSEFGLGFVAGGIAITADFLTKVSYVSLFLISLLACGMMGVITTGKVKLGLKYAPIVVGGSIIVFIIAKGIISSMFGGLT